tara:strand:+ start:389 stop:922 length:534 start_codon:yes stop_codon:yes gene_type:complete
MFLKKRGQVWVETAVYTLIGLSLIAIILSMATPQIEKIKDKTIIEQTISAFGVLDNKITEVQQSEGQVGKVVFKITKGRIEINSNDNSIKYVLEDTKLEYTEPGVEIKQGNIIVKTEESGSRFNIILLMNYNLDISNKNGDVNKILQSGAVPYNILMENKGGAIEQGTTTQIEFNIV